MDSDSFIIHIKTEGFYEDIADDVKRCLETAKYSEDDKRPLPTGMNKKVIGSMINQLGAKIMIEFVTLIPKTYSYLTDNDKNVKKANKKKKMGNKRNT